MAITRFTRRNRLKKAIRNKIAGTAQKPRLSVFRSNKSIYGQLIDDVNGRTLVAISAKEAGVDGNVTVDSSKTVGQALASKASDAGIKEVVFDRNGYRYHGQVKSFADGVREGGLKF